METQRVMPSRRRWSSAVYNAAQEYLDSHPGASAAAIADALPELLKGPDSETPKDTPQESTIRDWLRKRILVVRDPADRWTVASAATADEARLVLPALAFLRVKTGATPRITKRRAKWLAKLRAIDPEMPPGAAVVLARLYEAYEDAKADTADIDAYLAMADWSEWGEDGSRPPMNNVWLTRAGTEARR